MAAQTPGSFDSFIRTKGLALTRTDVEGFAYTEEQKATRNLVCAGVALLPIVAAVVANSVLQSSTQSGLQIFFVILIYFGVAISMAVASVFFLMTVFATKEAGAAKRALRRYDQRDAGVLRANHLAAAEAGIALFLRSFSAEDGGFSAAEIDQYYVSEAQKMLMYSQMSGGIAQVPANPLPVKNVWLMQAKALATVRQRVPTVLLDNVSLSSEKQTELDQPQLISIPVFGEWWPVFIEFAGKARLIVIFLESATTSLSREIEFVVTGKKPCVLICSEELRDTVSQSQTGILWQLLEYARVVTYCDSETEGALEKKLEAALIRELQDRPSRTSSPARKAAREFSTQESGVRIEDSGFRTEKE